MPDWFANNLPQVVIGAFVVVTALIVWLVQRSVIRIAFVSAFLAVALFVFVNRLPLERCARTCECRVASQDITVPLCDPEVP